MEKVYSIWFTGLPCAGKTTLAQAIDQRLRGEGFSCILLDGDIIRRGLNSDLGFGMDQRKENIRRVAELSKLLLSNGLLTLNSFIAPTNEIRSMAKEIVGADRYIEIFVDTPMAECERRDTKGMYAKARAGVIQGFTGISSIWEPPMHPEYTIKTAGRTIEACVEEIYAFLNPILV